MARRFLSSHLRTRISIQISFRFRTLIHSYEHLGSVSMCIFFHQYRNSHYKMMQAYLYHENPYVRKYFFILKHCMYLWSSATFPSFTPIPSCICNCIHHDDTVPYYETNKVYFIVSRVIFDVRHIMTHNITYNHTLERKYYFDYIFAIRGTWSCHFDKLNAIIYTCSRCLSDWHISLPIYSTGCISEAVSIFWTNFLSRW